MGIISGLFKRKSETAVDKRFRPRLVCSIPTEIMDRGGRVWSCKIVNMSEKGFGITTTATLKTGAVMDIIKPTVRTQVVWAEQNRAGLRVLN